MNKPDDTHKTRTIEVKLTVPKIGWLEKIVNRIAAFYKKKWAQVASVALVVMLIGAVSTLTVLRTINAEITSEDVATNPLVSEQDLTAKVPYYETLMPGDKTIEELGGWTRVSPTDRNAVFAYDDTIGVDRIVVSQQPLPEDFKEDTAFKVEELAKGYKATEKLTLDNLTVHIANSAKGPQSVIFHKNGLLVLIRSSVQISVDAWTAYITALM